ncbi:MAG: CBS domain-containing protein [Rhodovulum sp.]|jgi:CBS domain-containing protein|nr:histidine kinase [Rhodovulum sp.]MCI5086235.1 CBS domain-containing protein [Rhodovulum sp.]|tara:strand:- start:2011 stop:2445 length:435 start_codon:yes stop_codon:yes gene_type:complete
MLVRKILGTKETAGVLTIPPSMTVGEAAAELSSRKIGCLIVSTDGKTAAGILSERDIVRELGRRGAGCLADPVSELMTQSLVTCGPDETADDVLGKMTQGRFRHMPVLEEGEMLGLISIGDVVKARLSELSMEKDALQGMIMGH